jgi:predicted O-methyltransferase YrrM
MIVYRIWAYLKFCWISKNEYSIHSPFIYDLATKCFYDKKSFKEYSLLRSHRKNLYNSTEVILVSDFGAGSTVFKSNRRKVSAIAGNAGICSSRARLLLRMVRYFKPQNILELGTSVGLATAALRLGNPQANLISIEGCAETAKIASRHLASFGLMANQKTGSFEQILPTLSEEKFDFIYFDGNHTKEATLKYFGLMLSTLHNDSVWIFDDIHWSAEMNEAWEQMKNHPRVSATIDTWQWGIVFFRKEQLKEHFTLRC